MFNENVYTIINESLVVHWHAHAQSQMFRDGATRSYIRRCTCLACLTVCLGKPYGLDIQVDATVAADSDQV